jgi:hypothetical protein
VGPGRMEYADGTKARAPDGTALPVGPVLYALNKCRPGPILARLYGRVAVGSSGARCGGEAVARGLGQAADCLVCHEQADCQGVREPEQVFHAVQD